jgi:hypothetical protein
MRGGFTRENGSSVFLCVCVWGGGGVTRDEGDEGAQG